MAVAVHAQEGALGKGGLLPDVPGMLEERLCIDGISRSEND